MHTIISTYAVCIACSVEEENLKPIRKSAKDILTRQWSIQWKVSIFKLCHTYILYTVNVCTLDRFMLTHAGPLCLPNYTSHLIVSPYDSDYIISSIPVEEQKEVMHEKLVRDKLIASDAC